MLRILLIASLTLAAVAAPALAESPSVQPLSDPPPSALAPAAEAPEPEELPELQSRVQDPFVEQFQAHKNEARNLVRSPEAALPLLRAYTLRDRLPSLAPLASLFSEFANNGSTPVDVRALARFLLGQVERSRGRLGRADAQFARLGFLTRFQVIGPFENEGKSGCDRAYAPETGLDLSASVPGKARPVGWRKLPEVARDGYIDLGAAISPSDESVAYALAMVESPTDQRAVLHLGASGASRLWVNGILALSANDYHAPRLDQDQVAVTLRKGSNRVLLKLCQDTGPHGFYLRLTNPQGELLRGVTTTAPEGAPTASAAPLPPVPPVPRGSPAPERLPTLADAFRRRAESARKDARARAAYAEYLGFQRAFDARERRDALEAAEAARLAPREPALLLLAAATADDTNERRRYLESVLALQPNQPEATAELARQLLDQEQPRRALELLEPAARAAPGWYPLELLRARALEELGLSHKADATVEALLRSARDRAEVLREAARRARRLERAQEAIALYRVALSLRFDDMEARRALVAVLTDLGDVGAALKEQREFNTLEPFSVHAWLRTGELAAANGQLPEARRAFDRAVAIAPEDPDVFERTGRALARLGDAEAATTALARALELKPQNPLVKETLKALRQEGRGFGEEWAHELRELGRTPATPGEDAVVLAQLHATKVFSSGLAARFVQSVIRVQTPRGVEAERQQWITYSPDRQDLKILRARILKPDGSEIESHTESERSLSDDESKLYYDARGRIIGFPNLAPGDVVELSYRLDDVANDNLLSDYFGELQSLQNEHPTARFDYYLLMPPGRPLYASQPSVAVTKVEEPRPDGAVLHHWSARAVPKFVPEPGMPGLAEIAVPLHVSTYKDWESVGRYYWGLVREQLTPTEEVRAAYREITKGIPAKDERAIVRAVYDFVVSRTRYVGLEFGIHGYKPYRVEKILARRFGDCKDKASLMHALLEVGGIESRMVLLRMRRLGRLSPQPASLAIFDHAILYVPKFDLFLDGTAELFGTRELPSQDRGATVLVVDPRGASVLRQIPEAASADNGLRTEARVAIAASGAAALQGKTVAAGLFAPDFRRTYQAQATRRQSYERGWARAFPGASVKELSFGDLTAIEKDVELAFSLEIPRFAQPDGGGLSFLPFGQAASYVENYAPLSARQHDLVLSFPWTNRSSYRYVLPPGVGAPALPSNTDVTSPFGRVKLTYAVEGNEVRVDGEIALSVTQVPKADYPAFRAFLGQIDQALGRKVRLARTVPVGPSADAR